MCSSLVVAEFDGFECLEVAEGLGSVVCFAKLVVLSFSFLLESK